MQSHLQLIRSLFPVVGNNVNALLNHLATEDVPCPASGSISEDVSMHALLLVAEWYKADIEEVSDELPVLHLSSFGKKYLQTSLLSVTGEGYGGRSLFEWEREVVAYFVRPHSYLDLSFVVSGEYTLSGEPFEIEFARPQHVEFCVAEKTYPLPCVFT